jgi:TAG lipase / steryl ester hydrolase / phospholipase A2 / LPA acyltransferase
LNRRRRDTQQALANAQDYRTWREAAASLDRHDGLDDWKADETSDLYDWRLIRSRLRHIRTCREEGAVLRLAHHLRQGLHWNLGNVGTRTRAWEPSS